MQGKIVCSGCGNEMAPSAKFCTSCGKMVSDAEDILTADNVSRELLKSIFDAAYMDVTLGKGDGIIVKEGFRCLVLPKKEQNLIKLLISLTFKPQLNDLQKLEFVNKVNKDYIIVRATANKNSLICDHDIMMDGGLKRAALVQQVKRFCMAVPKNLTACGGANILE